MATITITNLTSAPIYLNDLMVNVDPGAANAVTTQRDPGQIPNMVSTMAQVQEGNMSFSVAYTAAELGSGMMTIPASGPAATQGSPSLAAQMVIRMPFTSVVGDVPVYGLGQIPGKVRLLSAELLISTSAGGTVNLWTGPLHTGTEVASIPAGATGPQVPTAGSLFTGTYDLVPSASTGLFLNSATAGNIGELVLTVQFGA